MIACAHCGAAMPKPTGRASRKRFCNVECRKAAWRERHRPDQPDDIVPLAVPKDVLNVVSDDVTHIVPGVPAVPTAFPDDVPTPGGQHRCPHCRQPLAVISVLVPAAAAHVATPEVIT